MTEKITKAQLQYYAGMRALSEEEQKELSIRQAKGCRALTEDEIREHQLKMIRLYRGT